MLKTLKTLDLQTRIMLIALSAGLVVCLVMMTVSPARSALVFQSDDYVAEIQQTHIGVTLTENGVDVDPDAKGVGKLLDQDAGWQIVNASTGAVEEFMAPGQVYREFLSVKNVSADMDEYVRLTVRKYWAAGEDGEPQKSATLDPALIELVLDDEFDENWVRSDAECTDEREVYYYRPVLEKNTAAAPAVAGIRVSDAIKNVKQDYSNCYLALSAQVDSVQVNNAAAAAKSAWGVDVQALGLDQWSDETAGE